jgi:GT2 family glycosyltransferase
VPDALRQLPAVDALAAQVDAPPFEVVLVDDASPDAAWDALERAVADGPIDVHLRRRAVNGGPAAARNDGWRRASAPWVAFTDDDCVPDRTWLSELAACFDGADVVQGRTTPDPAQLDRRGPFSRTLSVPRETGHYQTCNIAYRRHWLERLGGFDEAFRVAEDTDLAHRAIRRGARTAFVDSAVVLHDVSPSRFTAAVRATQAWSTIPLAVGRHPHLRDLVHRRVFWKASHPPAIAALAAVALATAPGRRRRSRRVAAVTLLAWYPWFRTRRHRLAGGPRRSVAAIPGALVVDLAEVAAMARGSWRHRTFLL